jgi:hypothetical protein
MAHLVQMFDSVRVHVDSQIVADLQILTFRNGAGPQERMQISMANPRGARGRERLGNLQHSAVLSVGGGGPVAG